MTVIGVVCPQSSYVNQAMTESSAEEKALRRLKFIIEDETSTADEMDELLKSIENKGRSEWVGESPLVTAAKFKRKDIIVALVKNGFNINSTVKNHLVSLSSLFFGVTGGPFFGFLDFKFIA